MLHLDKEAPPPKADDAGTGTSKAAGTGKAAGTTFKAASSASQQEVTQVPPWPPEQAQATMSETVPNLGTVIQPVPPVSSTALPMAYVPNVPSPKAFSPNRALGQVQP